MSAFMMIQPNKHASANAQHHLFEGGSICLCLRDVQAHETGLWALPYTAELKNKMLFGALSSYQQDSNVRFEKGQTLNEGRFMLLH